MQIKLGGFYKRCDGVVVGPAVEAGPGITRLYPWEVDGIAYTNNGKYLADDSDGMDLVEWIPMREVVAGEGCNYEPEMIVADKDVGFQSFTYIFECPNVLPVKVISEIDIDSLHKVSYYIDTLKANLKSADDEVAGYQQQLVAKNSQIVDLKYKIDLMTKPQLVSTKWYVTSVSDNPRPCNSLKEAISWAGDHFLGIIRREEYRRPDGSIYNENHYEDLTYER